MDKEAIPKIVLEKTGKEATPEFIEGATRTFGTWWLNSLEDLKRFINCAVDIYVIQDLFKKIIY